MKLKYIAVAKKEQVTKIFKRLIVCHLIIKLTILGLILFKPNEHVSAVVGFSITLAAI